MNDFEHLPEDLQDIARAIAAHRDVPDGHLLERVLARVKASPKPRRRLSGFFRARLAALSMLGLILGLNVTGALASVLKSLGVSTSTTNSLNFSNLLSSVTNTVSTGINSQSAADEVYCQEGGKSGSDDNSSGGSDDNSSPMTSVVKGNPVTSYSGKTKITTYTQTTTTTTQMSSDQNGTGGSENNGQCQCQTSTSSGSEKNGGSEQVTTKVDTYTNNKITATTTSTTYKDGDTSGSENNGQCSSQEKPGCGNEWQNGSSGASGVHGGQPPMGEERTSCPHTTGQEGPPGYTG